MPEIECQHGDAYNLEPFLAYLCTDEAEFIDGSVFGVTGARKIEYFSESEITSSLTKDGIWKIDKLTKVVLEKLLKHYLSISERDSWKGNS
jgi:hypothetical protein